MSEMVNIYAAKTQFSRLIDRVLDGEEIVIARHGRPVARLVPMAAAAVREPGLLAGRIDIADDFDAPLPGEVLDGFTR